MSELIDLITLTYWSRLCSATCAFIKRLLPRKRLPCPLHKAPLTPVPQTERLTLEVKFSTCLTRRTL